jgi:hypothetical protein
MATQPPSQLQDAPPNADTVTAYDLSHSKTYLRLLDAYADGATWQEAAQTILGADSVADVDRAQRMHDAHLARAQWMTRSGYRHLLQRAKENDQ